MKLSIRSAAGALAALLVLCAAACGGSGSKAGSGTTTATTPAVTTTTAAPAATTYTLAKTRKCLDASAGIHAYLNNNKIVNGSGGELRVDFGYGFQWIYIAFGKDSSEAKAIEQHAVAVTLKHDDKLDRKTVVSGVRRKGNVFYYADGGPVTEVEGSQVDACLK